MLYLHDKKTMQKTVKTLYLQDFKTVQKVLKNDSVSNKCFLSCMTSSVTNASKSLAFLPQENSSFLLSCKRTQAIDNTEKRSPHYRANEALRLSHYASSKSIDGVSGPSFNNDKVRYILAFDPGLTGAMAVLKLASIKGDLTLSFNSVYDLPTYFKVGSKKRQRLDLTSLSSLLDLYSTSTQFAIIEDVASRPTDGHVGAFTFGFATGAIHGALAMASVKIEKVRPEVWKTSLGLDSDKSKSINLAIKLFPESSKYLKRKQDHGRAEAILLGWFAFKHIKRIKA